MAFDFTPHMATVSNLLWAVISAVGACLCFVVLLVIAAVWCHPKSRIHLDRVSFRIVTYALIANMIFGISSAVGGLLTGPGFLCGFSIFILQLTLQLSSFLLFSIALNLQLVVVHGINGQMMEKYYLFGSVLMTLVLVVPPYAAGQYGWDPLEKDCWYTNDIRGQRIIWQVTTQMMWTALTVVGEICCSTAVLLFMLRHTWRQRRIFNSSQSFSGELQLAPQVSRAISYKQIIIRVAMYPVASCCVNLISVVTALHSTVADGIHDSTDYNVLLLSDILYGGRAIVYACLAASDPALIRGVKTLLSQLIHGPRSEMGSSYKETSSGPGVLERGSISSNPVVVHIELTTIHSPPLDPGLEPPIERDKRHDTSESESASLSEGACKDGSIGRAVVSVNDANADAESVPGVPVPVLASENVDTGVRGVSHLQSQSEPRRRRRRDRQEQDTFKRQI